MSADLVLHLKSAVQFDDIMKKLPSILTEILKLGSIPQLICELPPAKQNTGIVLRDQLIDIHFPGAYIKFQERDESVAHFQVFQGSQKEPFAGCGATASGMSQVLTAALAIATAQVLGEAMIEDYGTHWLDKEKYTARELMDHLMLSHRQANFINAIDHVYHKLAIHKRLFGAKK